MKETYCVYEHVFPDGKKYIGLTKNAKSRWSNNGSGYSSNVKMRKAIEKYGWENVTHTVIENGLTKKQAQDLEKKLIEEYDTIKNGYNNRSGGTTGTSLYSKHVSFMLQVCKRAPDIKIYEPLRSFADDMYEWSDDESWAYQVNLVDCILRTHVEAYKHSMQDEPLFEACDWYYYMSHWVVHPEIDICTLPSPNERIEQKYGIEWRGEPA